MEKETDEVKKDRTKDLDPSVKQMIENALATKKDEAGELCKDFISLYNSKPMGVSTSNSTSSSRTTG